MKTFKVFLNDYMTEQLTAENFAVDDQNNLVVGENMFHRDAWKRVQLMYEHAVDAQEAYDNPYYGGAMASTGSAGVPTSDYPY